MSRRSLTAVGLLAALTAAGCGGGERSPGAPHISVPSDFVGVVSEDAFASSGTYRREQLAAQARAGVGLVRQTFDWNRIELRPGRYDLRPYDAFVAAAARAGLTVMPVLFRAPAFHARRLRSADSVTAAPPRDPRSMARFATVLVRRYGPGGSLWRERPELPRRPIRAWQVWNEPNLPVYWGERPNAREYVELLRTVGRALRQADPGAQVVSAGLPESKLGVPFTTYLRAMYRAGAAGTFNALGINAYARRVTGVLAAIAQARRVTASAEDGDVPIWVTEIGWATPPGPRSDMTVGLQTQAKRVRLVVRHLARERRRLRLRGFVYYAWRDASPYPGGEDFWGLHTGLLDKAGRPKPALAEFARAIHRNLRIG